MIGSEVLQNAMRYRVLFACISAAFVLVSFLALLINGLNLGLDFTGGLQVQLSFAGDLNSQDITQALTNTEWQDASVRQAGDVKDFFLTISTINTQDSIKIANDITSHLQNSLSTEVTIKQSNFIGAQIGSELRDQSGIGFVVALLCMMVYLAIRFQYKFACAAVVALMHDVILVLGVFALFGLPFDIGVLAAVLAIIGYSINDTIVVFDRIRENFHIHKKISAASTINQAIYLTLERTFVTSLTTLLVVIAIIIFGGISLYAFAIALFVGILVGTYSSIFIAPNIVLLLKLKRDDIIPERKVQLDAMP